MLLSICDMSGLCLFFGLMNSGIPFLLFQDNLFVYDLDLTSLSIFLLIAFSCSALEESGRSRNRVRTLNSSHTVAQDRVLQRFIWG